VSAQVLFARHGGVGLVTLNRPEKLNAFADQMRQELAEVVREAAADAAIRAVVITGAGRAFCAGADVARMYDLVVSEDWDALEALVDIGASVVRTIDGLSKPVLAAVNGAAAGGGANLALACDIRIAAARASIGQTFCRLGLQPDWGGTYFLPRLVGLGRALELVPTDRAVQPTCGRRSSAQRHRFAGRADRGAASTGDRLGQTGHAGGIRDQSASGTRRRAGKPASPAQDTRSPRGDARLPGATARGIEWT
jgi:hypothetical protein